MRHVTPLAIDRVSRDVGVGDAEERLARRRLAALTPLTHPGLCVPLDIRREDDAVVACSPRVAGVPLDAAGQVARVEEWVWLLAGLADALAALHDAGLAHGDVAPGNVVVGSRPVLVDLVGPALGRERGTPGFAAPSRSAGGAPTPADDVYSLGALGIAVAGEAVRDRAEAWMAPLLAEDPAARPSARAVAAGLERCAAPERWTPAGATVPGRVARVRTVRDPRAWHWRLRRRPWVLAAVLTAVAVAGGLLWWSPPVPVPSWEAPPAQASSRVTPAEAAAELTRARVDALARGDPEALASLAVPGTEPWVTASREARQLKAGARFVALGVSVGRAAVVDDAGATATVELDYALTAHTLVGADGTRVDVPAQHQRVRLELAWSGERWRVAGVSAAP